MRVWDIEAELLCNSHLLGEHREIHAIWAILIENKKGYSHHPETLRWKGKLLALYNRHEAVVAVFIDQPARQQMILRSKRCKCKL
jgi:hypothetical protein